MKRFSAVTCAVCLMGGAPLAFAAAGPSAPAAPTINPPYPVREMTMANVRQIYGQPQKRLAPVPATGSRLKPPITRWVYPDFTVYFERNRVIHTVLTHPRKAPVPHSGG